MKRMLVTCPETAHLEEIEFERTPCGLVIGACSRFAPRDAMACPRECAARLDRRERKEIADRLERVLVMTAHPDAKTSDAIAFIADQLRRDAFTVELGDAGEGYGASPADYEAVVIVAPHSVHGERVLRGYTAWWRDELEAMPTFAIESTIDRATLEQRVKQIADEIPSLER
jgi:hypothetical protein